VYAAIQNERMESHKKHMEGEGDEQSCGSHEFGARRQSAAMLLWVLDMLFSFNSLAKIFFFLKK
jgi:hypothetical protein